MRHFLLSLMIALASGSVAATSLADLSPKDTGSGLKEALTRGAEFAVSNLGKQDGFMGNPKVRIPLPGNIQKASKLLHGIGLGKQIDELELTMNRAAEQAVVEAKPILLDSIKKMSWQDAKAILTGGDDAATQYFKRTTSEPIHAKFLPIVKKSTGKLKLADKYNKVAGKAAGMGMIDKQDADLDGYVTHKAMDGLYLMIAEQERSIRKDPIGTGSKLLGKVFGAVGR